MQGAWTVSNTAGPGALNQVAGPRIPSSSASGAEITKVRCCGARRVDRGACIEFYAQPATATERAASTRGHDGNIVEEAYRGRYARQRLLNFWPESSCGYHAIKRFVCIIQVTQWRIPVRVEQADGV